VKARTTFQQLIAAASTALYACPVAEGREGAAAAAIALGLSRTHTTTLLPPTRYGRAPVHIASPDQPSNNTCSA
jgi:hypothetical protein